MKPLFIPSLLALGLASSFSVLAQDEPTAKKPARATSPPIRVPSATSPPVQVPATPIVPGKAVSPAVAVTPPKPVLDPAVVKSDSSYGLGFRTGGEFGQRYGNFGMTIDDIDSAAFIKGFLDGFQRNDPSLSEEKLGAAMQAFGDMLQQREKELATINLTKGTAFLAEHGKNEDVITTDSGLQYKVINKGGDQKYVAPKEGEAQKQFLVNYKGTLIDGTEFDASPEGQPVAMTMQVIDGFKEALTMMPVGSKWKVVIPSSLAYGDQRRSIEIGPNSTLVFELELTAIEDAPAPQNPGLPFPLPGGAGGPPQGQ